MHKIQYTVRRRFNMNDTIEIITCPACGKEMHKLYMQESGTSLDVCLDGCGGIFFDGQELKHFDENSENLEELKKAVANKTFEKTDESKIRICPVCGNNMVKNHVSVKHEITIDECYNCGAKFFDHGELTKMRNQYATEEERRQDLLSSTYNETGAKIDALEMQHNINLLKRSKFLKLLDKIFLGY